MLARGASLRDRKSPGFADKNSSTGIAKFASRLALWGRKGRHMPRRLLTVVIFTALALSVAASPAFAAQVSQEGYNTPAGVVQSDVASGNTNATHSTSGA